MAITTLTDARVYMAEFNLSGDHNKIGLDSGYRDAPNTVFGMTAESVKKTLAFVDLTGQGYVTLGSGLTIDALQGEIGVADVPVSVSPSGTEGDPVEFFKAMVANYKPFGGAGVGEHMAFEFSAKGQGVQSAQGTIHGIGSKSSTGNGTGYQDGAAASTDTIYAALHVLSKSGSTPTLDVVIESDDNSGFTSATTRLTFAQKTDVGSEFLSAVGPFTDDWWRATWALGGTTPVFGIVAVFGIESHA